jgi:hypothetical protein
MKVNDNFKGEYDAGVHKRKMMIKRVDTYLGIGDKVLDSNTLKEAE